MTEIRMGEKGYIEAGEDHGRYIVVQDDRARTGGYLIFLSNSPEFESEVFDHWAENDAVLARMLADSRIRWMGDPLLLEPGFNRPVALGDAAPELRIGVKGVREIWARRDLSSPARVESRYLTIQADAAAPGRYIVYTSESPDFSGEVWVDRVEGEEALRRYLAGAFAKAFRWTDEPVAIDPDPIGPIADGI